MPRRANDTSRAGSEGSEERFRWILPSIAIAVLAVGAFLISFAATVPARIALEYVAAPVQLKGITGTVWNGGATIQSGHFVDWRLDGFGSVARLALVFEVTLIGPETELNGRLTARPRTRRVTIADLTGQAGWPLVALVAPGLEIACDVIAAPRAVALELGPGSFAGSGKVSAGPGTCTREGRAEVVPMPALLGTLSSGDDGLRIEVVAVDDPETPLGLIVLANRGALIVTVFPEGAALVPGMPASSETIVEYPMSGLSP